MKWQNAVNYQLSPRPALFFLFLNYINQKLINSYTLFILKETLYYPVKGMTTVMITPPSSYYDTWPVQGRSRTKTKWKIIKFDNIKSPNMESDELVTIWFPSTTTLANRSQEKWVLLTSHRARSNWQTSPLWNSKEIRKDSKLHATRIKFRTIEKVWRKSWMKYCRYTKFSQMSQRV